MPREAVLDAIRAGPNGSEPGPSRLRPDNSWTLWEVEQAALVYFFLLLWGTTAVKRFPAVACHDLGSVDLLLLTNVGGLAPKACHASGSLGCRRRCAGYPPWRSGALCARRRWSCWRRRSSGKGF